MYKNSSRRLCTYDGPGEPNGTDRCRWAFLPLSTPHETVDPAHKLIKAARTPYKTNLTRYSAVTHTVVQGRDTHATDCCRWAFSRSIVHMSSGNRPSLLACAPGMMPQGASKRTRGLLFLLVCSWIGRSLHFGPTARVRWYRQPLLSVGIAHWVI